MKFRRKNAEGSAAGLQDSDAELENDLNEASEGSGTDAEPLPPAGPWDIDDLDDDLDRIDLGSLLIAPSETHELRLQVDETSGAVQSVLLTAEEGALELLVFAAPRNGDLWSEVLPQIAADLARRGGTATERAGRFGPELMCQMGVQLPDGSTGVQPTRYIGINGPRWLLRATLFGRPAMEPDSAEAWEDAIAGVVVRRGDGAMPVGEPLAFVMPPEAKRVDG